MLLAGTLLVACAPRRYGAETGPSRASQLAALPALRADRLLIPDRSGVSPNDTTVEFSTARGRTIVLRHAPPDNAVFAIIEVPADSSAAGSTALGVAIAPGRYGVTITAEPGLPDGTRLTFSYAIHFQAPPQVPSTAYPTIARYAEWLGVVRDNGDSAFKFLAHLIPGDDMIRVTLPDEGTYLLAAPASRP